ncbi:MAG: TadE/TadG family type IV pilus assembly protein, partial [Desulfobulbia bacterium]
MASFGSAFGGVRIMTTNKIDKLIYEILKKFLDDRQGAIVIYVAIALPVFIGMTLLAVDGSRFYNLHTFLQKGADSFALAAAAELDRKPTAIIRANRAIANLVENQHKFSNAGTATVDVSSIRFLTGLPASDASSIGGTYDTTDPALARFVQITVVTQTLNTLFLASFLGASNTATATARAVAGFNAAVCQFTPMFMCNPFEGSGTSIFDAANDQSTQKRQIVLRKKGGGSAQYSSGNYGFLQPPDGQHGANVIREMLGMARPPACFIQNGVELRPGFIASADQGLNVRFDMFDGPMGSKKNDIEFRPARNVRKGYGYTGNACNASLDPPNQGFPEDNCFATSSCPYMGGRMGDGDWDIDNYKSANNLGAIPYSNSNSTSRYNVYRYEIENNLSNVPSNGGEVGAPQCYGGGGLNDDPDRRILYIAVLDCAQHNVADDNSGNSGPPV